MARFIAFLRAVNVGGRVVKMDELRALFEGLGLARVETFIASGNVIFESRAKSVAGLEQKIEQHLLQSLGYEVKTFLRTDAEVAAIARYPAFGPALLQSAVALNVGLLAEPLSADLQKILDRFRTGSDEFHCHGRELYWLCRNKQSESDFSNAAFERALKVRTTFRGLNTIAKLAEKYPAA